CHGYAPQSPDAGADGRGHQRRYSRQMSHVISAAVVCPVHPHPASPVLRRSLSRTASRSCRGGATRTPKSITPPARPLGQLQATLGFFPLFPSISIFERGYPLGFVFP